MEKKTFLVTLHCGYANEYHVIVLTPEEMEETSNTPGMLSEQKALAKAKVNKTTITYVSNHEVTSHSVISGSTEGDMATSI